MRRLAPLVLALLAALPAAGCGLLGANPRPPAAPGEHPHVRVSVIATTDLAPFYIAQHAGLFRDAGIIVDTNDVIVAKSGGESVANLTSKTVDVAFSSYTPFFVAQAKHAGTIRFISDGSSAAPNTSLLEVARNSTITSVRDLAHARIGITARLAMSHLLVRSALVTNGVDVAGVQWVEMGFSQMGAALAAGQIDAAQLVQPQTTQAEEKFGTVRLLDLAQGPTANMPLTGYGALDEWVKANPDTAGAFQDAMVKAALIAHDHPEQVTQVMIDDLHVAPADAQVANLLSPGFEHTLVRDRLERPARLLHDAGGLPEIPNVDAMIWTKPAGH